MSETPGASWWRRWRGCCATGATRPPDGRRSWQKAGCPTGRSTTTFPAAWKNLPRRRSKPPARASLTLSARHWTGHPTQQLASPDSSTLPRDRSPETPAQAVRYPRLHSNLQLSALDCVRPLLCASTNGKASSQHGSGMTAGPMTRPRRPPRRLWLSSKAHYCSHGSADNRLTSPTPNAPRWPCSPPRPRNRPSGSSLGVVSGDGIWRGRTGLHRVTRPMPAVFGPREVRSPVDEDLPEVRASKPYRRNLEHSPPVTLPNGNAGAARAWAWRRGATRDGPT